MAPKGERARAEASAGAWAAAAVVLALGALGFGVASQFQVQDLSARLDRYERNARSVATVPVATTVPTSDALAATTAPAGSGEAAPPAETAEVEAAFVTLYDGSKPIDERVRVIDDPSGIAEAFQMLAPAVAKQMASLRARVHAVKFTSTVTATVNYAVQTLGGQPVQRVGAARLVDGTWKVARSTVCADLSDVGAHCPA